MIDFRAPQPKSTFVFDNSHLINDKTETAWWNEERSARNAKFARQILKSRYFAEDFYKNANLEDRAFFNTDTAKYLLMRAEKYGAKISTLALEDILFDGYGRKEPGGAFIKLARALCAPLNPNVSPCDYISAKSDFTNFSGSLPFDLLLYLARNFPPDEDEIIERAKDCSGSEGLDAVYDGENCYDAEWGFAKQLTASDVNSRIRKIKFFGDTPFLKKREEYGEETSLNLAPIIFADGREIPAGFICTESIIYVRNGARKIQISRPSAFVFSENVARRTFGRQLSGIEHKKDPADRANLTDAFGIFGELCTRG